MYFRNNLYGRDKKSRMWREKRGRISFSYRRFAVARKFQAHVEACSYLDRYAW